MEKQKNFEIFVINERQERGFKLIRSDCDGKLIADVKTKSRDKNVPPHIYIDAIEVIDQIAAAMNREERLLAYARLADRLSKNTDKS